MTYIKNTITGGIQSSVNSSTTPLASLATFTGTGELNNYSDVMVQVSTDQNGTLYVEFSPDGTNWDTSLTFLYDTDRINPPHIFVKGFRYYRTRFTNDSASAQTYLRLDTYYGAFQKLTSPINGTLAENYDAIVTRPTEFKYEVAMSKRQGHRTWSKWGYNDDVDTASEEIIASFGGTFNIMTTAATLDIVSTSASDGVAGAGATSIILDGIGSDGTNQTETIVMNGVTPVTSSNTWLGINRAYAVAFGASGSNVGTITISDTAGTVGTQAELPPTTNVTQQAIFHTQINHTFLADWLYINALKLSGGGGSPRVTIYGYTYSRVTGGTYQIARFDLDTDVDNSIEIAPSQPFTVGGREVIYFTAVTTINNTAVNLRFSGIEERID